MFPRTTTRLAAALGLACALMTAACADDFSPTEPNWAPALAKAERTGQTRTTTQDGGTGSTDSSDQLGVPQLVQSDLVWTTTTASVVIGPEGGDLSIWSGSPRNSEAGPYHELKVPRNAVSSPTLFVMQVGPDATIDLYLSATEISTGRRITEFSQALKLRMTYAGSAVEDASRLGIVYVADGIITERFTTKVNTRNQWLFTEIRHFSRYAVAWE